MSLRWRDYQQRKRLSLEGGMCIVEGCDEHPIFKCPQCGVFVCNKHRAVHWAAHKGR